MGMRRILSEGICPVNGEFFSTLLRKICSQRNCNERFRTRSAGQQARLAEDLKAVANAEHRLARGGEFLHRPHDRAEPRDGAGAQIIAIAEAARNDDCVKSRQRIFLVPDEAALMPKDIDDRVERVLVAIGGGKLENGEIHLYSMVK